MPNLLPVAINGHTIYIEAEPTYGIEDTTSADKALDQAEDAFERAKTTVTSMGQGLFSCCSEVAQGTSHS